MIPHPLPDPFPDSPAERFSWGMTNTSLRKKG